MTKFDPYRTLGVDPDATAEDVKRAYRARSRETHPDVAGEASRDAFERVVRSNLILSDRVRRDRYDRTGDADEIAPDNETTQAVSTIIGTINRMLAECDKQGLDPMSVDFVGSLRQNIQAKIDELIRTKQGPLNAAARYRNLASRLRTGPKSKLIVSAINSVAGEAAEAVKVFDKQIAVERAALVLLADVSFDIDLFLAGSATTVWRPF